MIKKKIQQGNISNITAHQFFIGLVVLFLVCVTFVGSTFAYYYADDFSSGLITMSGKVDIVVVSRADAYVSIEDDTDTNLIIYVEDNYTVHIPGAWFEPTANLKVYESTTKPLLRAKMDVYLINMETDEVITDDDIDTFDLDKTLYDSLEDIVESNGWIYYAEDKYYYYRNTNPTAAEVKDTILHEVDVPDTDKNVVEFDVIEFIDEEIQFPKEIDSTYSGYGVKIVIRFEAIQNYIPDRDGYQLPNTIENSKLIFDHPNDYPYA